MNVNKKTVFSPEQELAIETRDRTLLVSAAAGSGKTTTLTERIIRSLLDEENPESISRMLIVTFTNASVADLKEKVSRALADAYLSHPESARLADEMRLLEVAKISTIDSFCSELVRQNAERLGISPLYRIAESAEALILERRIMETLTMGVFSGEIDLGVSGEEFESVCDALTGVKNTSSLSDVFISLYEKTKSMVKGTDIFFDFANNYLQYSEIPLEKTPYGKYILNEMRAAVEHVRSLTDGYASPLLLSGEKQLMALGEDISEIGKRLSSLLSPEITYASAREKILSFAFPDAPTIRGEKPEIAQAAIEFRQQTKNTVSSLQKHTFTYSDEEWKDLFRKMGRATEALAAFLDRFSRTYFAEKKKRAILEFSDIERLAYEALWQDGALTDVAKEYRELFTSVYIDEYQDVNEIQNKIFEAVSPEAKRFMVGDIKQSIYGFRSARPEIFAEMKRTYPKISEEEYSLTSSIFMSNNYRCDEGIIDFVNEVFDKLFGAVRESIGFVPEDRLLFMKRYDGFTPEYEKAKICLLEDGAPATENPEDDEDDDEAGELSEAELVADRIKELLENGKRRDGSSIKPSDIAIIMRRKRNFSLYVDALKRRGINAEAPEDKEFFMNKEILLTLSLLTAIDNPRKDIYLAALLCSPLYNFSADEIYLMKREGNGETLYDSLLAYREKHPEFEKLASFLSALSHFRLLCEGMSVDTLLVRLYRETGLLALASKQGGKENLHKLYSYAAKFEGSQYKGLYNFITFINNLIERGAEIDKNEKSEKEDGVVSIGTIHSSKGLEFPVVFLAEAGAQLTNLDKKGKIAFAEDFGISFLLRGPLGLALVENPLHRVIYDYLDKKFYEEVIRLLYVALTRAKEKLYITGKIKGTADKYLEKMQRESSSMSPYSVRRMKSYMDMICATGADAEIFVYGSTEKAENQIPEIAINEEYSEEKISLLAKTLRKDFPSFIPTSISRPCPKRCLYPVFTLRCLTELTRRALIFSKKRRKKASPSLNLSLPTDRGKAQKGVLPPIISCSSLT